MKRIPLLSAAFILTSIGMARAERIEHSGCYASWSKSELIVGNGLVERKWRIKEGLLISQSFLDKTSGMEWLGKAGFQAAPFPVRGATTDGFVVSFKSEFGKQNPVEAESLTLYMTAKTKECSLLYRFQIFPKASGVGITFSESHLEEAPSAQAKTATEKIPPVDFAAAPDPHSEANASFPALEDLSLTPGHYRFTQVELLDQSDERNELSFEKEWLPMQETIEVKGNLFFTENILTDRGLVFVKFAPLPDARPVRSPWDARLRGGSKRLSFAGHGYPFVVLAYSGGRAGRIAVLHTYQRQLRAYDPKRDGMFLSNTWGDRSADGRISESFLLREIDAGARLGVDVIQIDDGWQKGMSANSSVGKGVWDDFYKTDPDFWKPHPTRFPNGLEPLTKEAKSKGMKFGIWFAPDTGNEMVDWERDADQVLDYYKNSGVEYVKIDAVKIPTRRSEENLAKFYDKVLRVSDGRVSFDSDATAGLRPAFFGTPSVGPVFVENRYTDFGRYWPHQTLRNLWKLSQYVDPLRLRMEFLNNSRNTDKYHNDPLAPSVYSPDALFASVMFSNPLGWFEVSNLPEDYIRRVSKLVKIWKRYREAIFSGTMIPIGSEPDGRAWTGFLSVSEDGKSGYAVIFRELNENAQWSVTLPMIERDGLHVTPLAGEGKATIENGQLTVTIPRTADYFFLSLGKTTN